MPKQQPPFLFFHRSNPKPSQNHQIPIQNQNSITKISFLAIKKKKKTHKERDIERVGERERKQQPPPPRSSAVTGGCHTASSRSPPSCHRDPPSTEWPLATVITAAAPPSSSCRCCRVRAAPSHTDLRTNHHLGPPRPSSRCRGSVVVPSSSRLRRRARNHDWRSYH